MGVNAKVVSTFGRWQTNDAGALIPNKDLGQVSPAGNVILNDIVLLRSEEGYQVYIDGLTNFEDDIPGEPGIQTIIRIFDKPQG